MRRVRIIALSILLLFIVAGCSKTQKTPDIKTKLGVIENYSTDKFSDNYINYDITYIGKKKQHSIEELNDVAQKMWDNNLDEVGITYEEEYLDDASISIVDKNTYSFQVNGNEGILICEIEDSKKDCTFYRYDYGLLVDDYYKDFYMNAKKGSQKSLEE